MTFDKVRVFRVLQAAGFLLLLIVTLKLLFPFYAALMTVALISLPVAALSRHTALSKRALRLLLLLLTLLLTSLAITALLRALIRESAGFAASFGEKLSALFALVSSLWEKLEHVLSISEHFDEEKLALLVSSFLEKALATLSTRAAAGAERLLGALPSFLFSFVFYLISLFYIAVDYDRLLVFFKNLIPQGLKKPFERGRSALFSLMRHTLKAYGILFILTFVLLSAAFFIFGIDYPIWWAFLTALLDALPAIGTGLILLPWGIGLLLSGQVALGIAMLCLYLAITVLRQILEPRILGRELGVPPLLSLISLYLAFRLFGGIGLLLSPILSVLLTRLFHAIYTPKLMPR